MKVVTLAYFIDGAEKKLITEIFPLTVGSEKRVYGIDSSYDFLRASQGKVSELVYAVVT